MFKKKEEKKLQEYKLDWSKVKTVKDIVQVLSMMSTTGYVLADEEVFERHPDDKKFFVPLEENDK